MNTKRLLPFRGFLTPGLYFSSGYCLFLINFDSTPTEVGAYFEVWLVTPDDKRVLYVDPEAAGPIVCIFHQFDEVVGASLVSEWVDADTLHVRMKAVDDTDLNVHVQLGSSRAAGILNALLKVTPRAAKLSRPMVMLSEIAINALLGLGWAKLAGKTETGKDYLAEADKLAVVKEASARLNGVDLGALSRPRQPILFGDLKVPNRALLSFVTLNLEYEERALNRPPI
jgi:hypothetical protein